jgi:hypothetical protein
MSTKSLLIGAGIILAVLVFIVVFYLLFSAWSEKEKNRKKSRVIMGGLKILFVTFQIIAGLPSIIPAIALPDNFKKMLSWMQFFNLNVFKIINVGCYTDQFDFTSMLLANTLTPAAFILLFLGIGIIKGRQGKDEGKKGFFEHSLHPTRNMSSADSGAIGHAEYRFLLCISLTR